MFDDCVCNRAPYISRSLATMIFYYGVAQGNALKTAGLYRRYLEQQPSSKYSKRMPGYGFFMNLNSYLLNGVIEDNSETADEQGPMNGESALTHNNYSEKCPRQLNNNEDYNLPLEWLKRDCVCNMTPHIPQAYATMIYFYGVTRGDIAETAKRYHSLCLENGMCLKNCMPSKELFDNISKSLWEGVSSIVNGVPMDDLNCYKCLGNFAATKKSKRSLATYSPFSRDSVQRNVQEEESHGTSTAEINETEEPKKPVERTCHSCKQTWFWGFVYRCLQCEFVHCAKCDAAGVHSEHYVLRVPSARPKKEEEAVMCKIWDAVNSCPFPPSATEHALLEQTGRVEPPAGSRGDQANSDTDDASANEQEEVEVKLEFEATEHDPLAAASAPALAEVPRPGVRVTQVHAPVVESTAGMQLAPEFFTSQVNLGMMIFKDEPPDYDEPCASTSDLPSTSHASLGDHTYFETHKKKETVPAKRKNDKNIESRQPKARRGRPRKKKIDTDQD